MVVPAFGFHPWLTHSISLQDPPLPKNEHYAALFLPNATVNDALVNENFSKLLKSLVDPIPLSQIIASVRGHFEQFPKAMLG